MGEPILFITDIHADLEALEAILSLAAHEDFVSRYGEVKKTINLGDVMERGYKPRETVERLKTIKNLASVLGNHDEAFLGDLPVSGSDGKSMLAHEEYVAEGSYNDFFKDMPSYHIEKDARVYAVHGGPLDPEAITPAISNDTEKWLHSRTWQRISEVNIPYLDGSGYHYLPAAGIDSAKKVFPDGGFIIVCGHQHVEAAYMQIDDAVLSIYEDLDQRQASIGKVKLVENEVEIDMEARYLLRLGISGPAGYARYYGWNRCHFGVLHDDGRKFSMMSFIR